MTYDQWKTTPPEERWGYLCAGCDAVVPSPGERCSECEREHVEEEALMSFYEWEPEGLDAAEEQVRSEAQPSGAN